MVLAPGFEEIEALNVVDILRRAEIEVMVAGTTSNLIEGRSGIKVQPDDLLADVPGFSFDMIVLPGGQPGTENLIKDERVIALVKEYAEFKMVGAICAAPTVLKAAAVTKGRRLTCHPSVKDQFPDEYVDERVVTDGNIITSQGPGTAIEFAYALVEALGEPDKPKEINKGVLAKI